LTQTPVITTADLTQMCEHICYTYTNRDIKHILNLNIKNCALCKKEVLKNKVSLYLYQ